MVSTIHNDIWLYIEVNDGWWVRMLLAVHHVTHTHVTMCSHNVDAQQYIMLF